MVTTSATYVTWGLDKDHNVWFHHDGLPANPIPEDNTVNKWILNEQGLGDQRLTALDVGRDG
jgi:hypothetical protein